MTGEKFSHDTKITDPGARLDIKARNSWRRGQDAFFDVCVTHVNAPPQKKQETKVTFHRHEERKKRRYMERCLYVEHATFTPLVIGTNGGMGDDLFSSDFYFQIYSDRCILGFNVLCSICVLSIKFMYGYISNCQFYSLSWVIFMFSPPLLDHWTLKSQNSALGL